MEKITFSRNSFDKLFFEYYKPLVAYAFGIMNERLNAEDIVQDVFVSVWLRKNEIDFTHIQAYLYKAVYHKSLSFLNTKKTIQHIDNLDIIESYLASCCTAYDPLDDLSVKELMHEIRQSVNALPEQCQRVFKLSRISGLSNKEIASLLQVSEKAVEKQMTKALCLLRVHIRKMGLLLAALFFHLN